MNRIGLLFISNANTTSEDAPLLGRKYFFCMQNKPMENHRGRTPNRSPIEVKDDSNACSAKEIVPLILAQIKVTVNNQSLENSTLM